MANQEQIEILDQGVEAWNKWREDNTAERPDLRDADLSRKSLDGVNFTEAILDGVNFSNATLTSAKLRLAYLCKADLSNADLRNVDLHKAYLAGANLQRARLNDSDLTKTICVRTDFRGADLTNCRVYGCSVWDVKIDDDTKQTDLVVTPDKPDVSDITVDDLKLAQFIYLLLDNEEIRDVIDTVGKKAVLILGRFTEERKVILDAIRDELRERGYVPILFDFEKPTSKDLTETVSTLAHMARFIIADLTEPKSIPHELATIVPTLSVPVQPLLLEGSEGEYAMFKNLRKYDWVLSVHQYNSIDDLLESFGDKIVFPAEEKAKELIARKQ